MNRIRVVIVDDEPLARRGIRQLLAAHADVEIAGEARNGRDAVRMLKALQPDVVFLDIQMPELDGFAVLRELDPGQVPLIIFVTAFDTFAVRAFDSQAVDYLVKPVPEARFLDALQRVRERLQSRGSDGRAPRPAPPRRLVIGTSGADLVVDLAEIEWIEADDYYAAVHARGRRHLVRESLASLEGRLDRSRFVRVHRSAIVNLSHVREVRTSADRDAAIVLGSGAEVPLSRRRREQVTEAIRRFAAGAGAEAVRARP
jgi:two-component system, LytTR family, response regulator